MFGTLKNTLNANWQKNTDNHLVITATEHQLQFWKVFSVYRIPNTNDYITVNYKSDAAFEKFIEVVKNRSVYDFGANVTAKDRVLTLSTCIGTGDRMVLHAVLTEVVDK
jgi:sortase B